jgi:hypothetical protein
MGQLPFTKTLAAKQKSVLLLWVLPVAVDTYTKLLFQKKPTLIWLENEEF